MTEKIQYFMSDLSYLLGIGDIKNIHIAEVDGRPVLRIECEKAEYKTVKANGTRKKPSKNGNGKPAAKTLTDRAINAIKDWKNKPTQPPWERRFQG